MAADIVMPRLSDSMEEGTILKWLKAVGDEVAVGDELVEIETDKANMVYEADAAGTLVEIVAAEGDTLAIGETIARVGEAGEVVADSGTGGARASDGGDGGGSAATGSAPASAGENGGSEAGSTAVAPEPPPSQVVAAEAPAVADFTQAAPPPSSPASPSPAGDGRVKASPIARRIAKEKGVDIAAIGGSGPGGRIVKADVERALAAGGAPAAAPTVQAAAVATRTAERPETAKGGVQVVELSKLQSTVARRMAESKATAPHFYLNAEIDMTRAVAARSTIKAAASEGDVVPSFNDMVVKACAIALRERPRANGAYRDGRLELYSRVNVGVAVAAQEALVVPTVFDADLKGLRQIAAETRELARKVRDGTVTPPELSGGTFTVSNLGMFGIDSFSAVINPPQAGILAVGAIKRRPVFDDGGQVTAADLMSVTLACDHRILYGAEGAEFLARVRELLEEPLGLAL